MNSPATDLKDILVAAGIGQFGATSGWSIRVSEEPISPDTCITLYDTGGFDPNAAYLFDFPTVQIRIRGKRGDYTEAYNKAWDIRETLLGLVPQDINGTRYSGIWLVSDIVFIGRNEERPQFSTNWRIVREPATGLNRRSG